MATKAAANTTAKKIAKRTTKASAGSRNTKVSKSTAAARQRAPDAEPLAHRLDALLHTMRCIAQHEDQLCSLLHDARRTGRISAAVRRDLQTILAELPAEEYTDDLHAVLEVASGS